MIYLDYASNTPADEDVLRIFLETERQYTGNPNSLHQAGRLAAKRLEQITESIAARLQVRPSEIIYTSGASESNNLALKGLARSYRHYGRHILTTCLEHSSVSGTLTALMEQGYEVDLIDIKPDGTIDLNHLRELIRPDTIILSLCYVDSELGTIQPVSQAAAILKDYPHCHLHADATQAIGKIPIHLDGIHCLTLAPHKFYGLNGCGLLVKKEDVILEPMIHGGVSTSIYRSGTPALALAAATAAALQKALDKLDERLAYVSKLQVFLIEKLTAYPLVRINSTAMASPYILNLSIKGVKADYIQELLDAHGVCVSTKSACAVRGIPSRPVFAVTGDKKNALYSFRISISHLTTTAELDEFLQLFHLCYKELTI